MLAVKNKEKRSNSDLNLLWVSGWMLVIYVFLTHLWKN